MSRTSSKTAQTKQTTVSLNTFLAYDIDLLCLSLPLFLHLWDSHMRIYIKRKRMLWCLGACTNLRRIQKRAVFAVHINLQQHMKMIIIILMVERWVAPKFRNTLPARIRTQTNTTQIHINIYTHIQMDAYNLSSEARTKGVGQALCIRFLSRSLALISGVCAYVEVSCHTSQYFGVTPDKPATYGQTDMWRKVFSLIAPLWGWILAYVNRSRFSKWVIWWAVRDFFCCFWKIFENLYCQPRVPFLRAVDLQFGELSEFAVFVQQLPKHIVCLLWGLLKITARYTQNVFTQFSTLTRSECPNPKILSHSLSLSLFSCSCFSYPASGWWPWHRRDPVFRVQGDVRYT